MKRTHHFENLHKLTPHEVSKQIAIHEAGHAVAIYLGNQQKGLPPVFFEIYLSPLKSEAQLAEFLVSPSEHTIAKIEGGRLIHTLPASLEQATKSLSGVQKWAYEHAFEADMINLLAGALAEAYYVALREGEFINPHLVNLKALPYYGGCCDVESVNEYLGCLKICDELRERKMNELFLAAFRFVCERPHWLAITTLADYILAADKPIIECNEMVAVLEAGNHSKIHANDRLH